MAKLSEKKKVELLEYTVLTGTAEDVARVFEEHAPFEFTARALGYAARFRGAELVKCLVAHGATFAYKPVPAFVKKYATKVVISNSYSYSVDYSLYLLKDQKIDPVPEGVQILADEERAAVLELLCAEAERACPNTADIFYFATLFGDTAVLDACSKLNICGLSEYRMANIRCDINYAHMDGLDRHHRDTFTWTLRRADPETFCRILTRILPLLGEKPMQLMPADLYEDFNMGKKQFFSAYCAEGLFELALKHTNLIERAKKWDLLYALVDQNNASGIQYALEQDWLTKPKDYATLLEYAQSKSGLDPALMAAVMQYAEKNASPKAKAKKEKSPLAGNPLSPSALKKDWTFKETADGTLIITSYKGSATEVIIPAEIGGKAVTEIGEFAFSPKKSRITKPKAEFRETITRVDIPDGVVLIGFGAFHGCSALAEINIPSSVTKILAQAFCGCATLTQVKIPESVQLIGWRAFSADDYLGHADKLTIYGKAGSEAENFAKRYYANFVAE